MENNMKIWRIAIPGLVLMLAGCAHQVTFHEASYAISSPRHAASVVVVITPETLGRKVPISAWMTGIAHTWEAEPGDMLRQVVAIEVPQVFARYDLATSYREPGDGGIVVEMDVPEYAFEDFHAKIAVMATVYTPGRKQIHQKVYRAAGETQGSKMFFGGAFAMKSAIRQSSLDAYKKIFAELRADLATKLPGR
jgi:hypothetical protein